VPKLSLELYSKEQLKEMSLIEIAYESLKNSKQAVSFNELLNEIAAALELSEEEVRARIAQFYTDLNIDGRFLALGDNRWGLRVWYPVDTVEEEVVTTVKPKKKKAKKAVNQDDVDFEDFEDVDEDFDDFDDYNDDDDELIEDDEDELDDVDEADEEFGDEDPIEDEEDFELEEDVLDEDLDDDEDELDEEEDEEHEEDR
jgi:DNA-directed RNA polymerase subunit delta